MAGRSAACPTCASVWHVRHARFCGHCGAVLPRRGDDRSNPRRRRLAAGMLVGGAAALLGGVAAAGDWPMLSTSEEEVALPGEADAPAARLPGRTVATLRWQTRPDRLQCEPAGCQAWYLALPEDTPTVVAAGTVVVLDGTEVVAINATDGAERWTWPVSEVLGTPYGRVTGVAVAADDHGIVLTSDNRIGAVGLDGTLRWTRQVDGPVWNAQPSNEVVLVSGAGHGWGGRYQQVVALDATTGDVRWTRDVHRTHVLDPDLVVVATVTGHVDGLEPVTGDVLWRRREYLHATVERDGDALVVIDHHGRQRVDTDTGVDVAPDDPVLIPARLGHRSVDPRTGEQIGQAMIGSTSGPAARRLEREADEGAFAPLDDGLAVSWDDDGVEIIGIGGPVRVSGGRGLRIASTDPLVVSARDQFLGVRVAGGAPVELTPP